MKKILSIFSKEPSTWWAQWAQARIWSVCQSLNRWDTNLTNMNRSCDRRTLRIRPSGAQMWTWKGCSSSRCIVYSTNTSTLHGPQNRKWYGLAYQELCEWVKSLPEHTKRFLERQALSYVSNYEEFEQCKGPCQAMFCHPFQHFKHVACSWIQYSRMLNPDNSWWISGTQRIGQSFLTRRRSTSQLEIYLACIQHTLSNCAS